MVREFLLHRDKKKEIPPHIQAHLALPNTKANALQGPKACPDFSGSLHFADPQTDR